MNAPESGSFLQEGRPVQNPGMARPRPVGSPLPMGAAATPAPAGPIDAHHVPASPPPPGRSLSSPASAAPAADDLSGSLQRIFSAVRSTLPFVTKLLPLLEGNVVTAVSNVLTQQPQKSAPPPPPVDLVPIQEGLVDLQTQHHELSVQVAEQNTSLKRVEDQLELVREATDRNTLEQQELLEDLKVVGRKVNIVATVAISLLVISVLVNLVLYLHIRNILP